MMLFDRKVSGSIKVLIMLQWSLGSVPSFAAEFEQGIVVVGGRRHCFKLQGGGKDRYGFFVY